MPKKLIITVIVAFTICLALVLCACDKGGSKTTTKTTVPSISSFKLTPVDTDPSADTANDLCLALINGKAEGVDVELKFNNPEKYEIVSLKINDTKYESTAFTAQSSSQQVFIENYELGQSTGNYTITVSEIFYRTANETKQIPSLTGNVLNVKVNPTFNLTLDFSAGRVDEGVSETEVIETKFLDRLAVPSPFDTVMTSFAPTEEGPTFGKPGFIFAGWYTEKDGQGVAYTDSDSFIFYCDTTLYAHYARTFKYRIEGEDEESKYAVVTAITEEGSAYSGNIEIPATVENYPVRVIGDNAFANCGTKRVFVLPDSVTEIGSRAFYGATQLQINLNNIEKIGYMAFSGCGKIILGSGMTANSRVSELPSSLREIGDYAFQSCSWDTRTLNTERATQEYWSESNTLVIPATLTKLGTGAFRYSGFTKVFFQTGSALTAANVGTNVFEESKALQRVYTSFAFTPSGAHVDLTTSAALPIVSDYMFYNCTALENDLGSGVNYVRLNEGVKEIGEYAFASSGDGMQKIKNLTFPDSLESIGKYGFSNTGLTQITFNPTSRLISLGQWCFDKANLSTVTLYSLSVYGDAPFYANNNLTEINILTDNVPTYTKTSGWGTGLSSKTKYFVKTELLGAFRSAWVDQKNIAGIVNLRETVADYIFSHEFIATDYLNVRYAYEPINAEGELDVTSNNIRIVNVFGSSREITVPSKLTVNGVDKTVVAVGKYFVYAGADTITGIRTVSLPNTLTSIDKWAFYKCTNLSSVSWYKMQEGSRVAANLDELALTKIGQEAFYRTSLTSFESNDALTKIEGRAFFQCEYLRKVAINRGTNVAIYESAFSESGIRLLVLSSNVAAIAGEAFGNNEDLTEVYLGMQAPPTNPAGSYPALSPFTGCEAIIVLYVFSENAKQNFKLDRMPDDSINVYKGNTEFQDKYTVYGESSDKKYWSDAETELNLN